MAWKKIIVQVGAVEILELLKLSPSPMSVTELAMKRECNRSAIRASLDRLRDKGFVVMESEGKGTTGYFSLTIEGWAYLREAQVRAKQLKARRDARHEKEKIERFGPPPKPKIAGWPWTFRPEAYPHNPEVFLG